MKPEELIDKNKNQPTTQNGFFKVDHTTKQAAANIIRNQIDNLYEKDSQKINNNPYERTHAQPMADQTEQWKRYHTAWQDYYQKYYEGYYTQHLKLAQQNHGLSHHLNNHNQNNSNNQHTVDDEMFGLKQELKAKVLESATKIKKSRHFIPLISGLSVFVLFIFMQYNQVIIANIVSYVSPGNIDPQNIIIDPSATTAVSADPRIVIPKINVDVPVSYDVGNDYDSQMKTMQNGLAHFAIPGASSHPGEIGNTVIAGHSSNDLLDYGSYKFIFAQLDKLNVGDIIYANYKSTRYTYSVTKKEVVKPNDVNSLVYQTSKPIITLLTCTPLGTATNRLLVVAEQISPDPSKSVAATNNTQAATTSIPGSSPTLLEQLFGRW